MKSLSTETFKASASKIASIVVAFAMIFAFSSIVLNSTEAYAASDSGRYAVHHKIGDRVIDSVVYKNLAVDSDGMVKVNADNIKPTDSYSGYKFDSMTAKDPSGDVRSIDSNISKVKNGSIIILSYVSVNGPANTPSTGVEDEASTGIYMPDPTPNVPDETDNPVYPTPEIQVPAPTAPNTNNTTPNTPSTTPNPANNAPNAAVAAPNANDAAAAAGADATAGNVDLAGADENAADAEVATIDENANPLAAAADGAVDGQATEIVDDENPMGAFDSQTYWYYIALLVACMAATAIYGAFVISRRMNATRKFSKVEEFICGMKN